MKGGEPPESREARAPGFHCGRSCSAKVAPRALPFAFDGAKLQRAAAACFQRRGTPWGDETPPVLTPAFYQTPALVARWRSYLAAADVLVQPPTQFEAIGARIVSFFGPVRKATMAGETVFGRWCIGGPWVG